MKKNLFIIIILLIFIFLLINFNNFENFNSIEKTNLETLYIDYYVIHMSSNLERKKNIEIMSNKINKNIKIFEAIEGKKLLLDPNKKKNSYNYFNNKLIINRILNELIHILFVNNINNINLNEIKKYDDNIIFNFNYKYINEVGCYLSHLMLIKSLLNTQYKYTIIFEDDFKILNNDFNYKINDILNKLTDDFDILYIGNLNNNHGKKYKDEIYSINLCNRIFGTFGYIINNKNIYKIYKYLLIIDDPIDIKYEYLINNNLIKAYVIYPILVGNIDTSSTIH